MITRCADPRTAWRGTDRGRRGARVPDCWLLLRPLRTLDVRVTRQNATAQRASPRRSMPPATATGPVPPGSLLHPDHAVAKRQMTSYGSILAVECRSEAAARALPEHAGALPERDVAGRRRRSRSGGGSTTDAVSPLLVRLSIGLEDPDDLIGDLNYRRCGGSNDVEFD